MQWFYRAAAEAAAWWKKEKEGKEKQEEEKAGEGRGSRLASWAQKQNCELRLKL